MNQMDFLKSVFEGGEGNIEYVFAGNKIKINMKIESHILLKNINILAQDLHFKMDCQKVIRKDKKLTDF